MTHNPNLEISLDIGSDNDNVNALGKVKVLLNHAKEYSQANRNVECTVDVLESLGVVYNVSREYDDAIIDETGRLQHRAYVHIFIFELQESNAEAAGVAEEGSPKSSRGRKSKV